MQVITDFGMKEKEADSPQSPITKRRTPLYAICLVTDEHGTEISEPLAQVTANEKEVPFAFTSVLYFYKNEPWGVNHRYLVGINWIKISMY